MQYYEETHSWLKFINPSVLSWCYSAATDKDQRTALSRSYAKVSAPVNITAPFASLPYLYSIEGKQPTLIKEKSLKWEHE